MTNENMQFADSNYLLNFGDSWANADGVDKEKGYSHQMACSLRMKWLNYSVSSSSAGRMVLQLQEFLNSEYNPAYNYTALFFITAQERQLLFNDSGKPFDIYPADHGEFYSKFYNHRLGNYSLNTTIITLQSICRRYKIKDHYLLGWQLPRLWNEVDTSKFYDFGRSSAINMFAGPDANLFDMMTASHPCLISNVNGHPSERGHQVIYSEWLKWIQQPRPELDQ